jgi:protein DGCR14
MATSSDTTALAKRSAETALMPPPPPPKRIKRPPKVLDEDQYTSALSHIIARDFFPGLLESETQQEFLDALDAGDKAWIQEAGQKVRQAMTPGRQRGRRGMSMTPIRGLDESDTPTSFRGQTPGTTPARTPARSVVGQEAAKQETIDVNLSLSAFQAKYTSEDNESFNKVLDRQNEARAAKYRWLYNNNKLPSKQLLLQASIKERKLLAAGETTSTSQAVTLRPSQDPNDRPASISAPPSTLSTTSQGARNAFMFGPDDIIDTNPQLATTFEEAQARSLAPPRAVTYNATRLPTILHNESSYDDDDTASLSLSAIDAAIRGRPRQHDLGSLAPSIEGPGNETPRVNGYAFVDAEPTPSEIDAFEQGPLAEDEIDGDLLQKMIASNNHSILSGGGGPNAFSISISSAREDLHHRLVDKTLAAKRKSNIASRVDYLKSSSGKTPVPKFASSPRISSAAGKTPGKRGKEALGGLTPAARMLYSKLGKTPVSGGGTWEDGEKGSWTPKGVGVKKT